MTPIEAWRRALDADFPKCKTPGCANAETVFSCLHGLSPEAWEAASEEERANAVIIARYLCVTCKCEQELDFVWPGCEPKNPDPAPVPATPVYKFCPHCGKALS